jgi:transcriptional regulator with PAS, ATPase and Fis domain
VESELFGHEAGSFTGAAARKRGLLELAEGGTVFLNEIAELSLPLQAKLLSFLDTLSFTRIGGERSISVNARVVAATNKDLAEEVTAGTFRQDLFYRLNVFPILIPPLRERLDDVPALAETLVTDLMKKMTLHEPPEIEPAAMRKLIKYPWPGNVRELRNVLERAAIMSNKKVITAGDVQLREGPLLGGERRLTTRLAVEEGSSLQDALKQSEADLIRKALDLCAGNVTQSAERLGLTREQLKYRMRSLAIKR